MALGQDGLFGERWLDTDEAFTESLPSVVDQSILSEYQGVLAPETYSNSFGKPSILASCIALHARMATSDYGLNNTHPFVFDDTALIHNGVIRNPDQSKMLMSTCDSEVILTDYINEEVALDLSNIQNVVDQLDGYYACAVISKDNTGRWILDVFKDSRANLSAVYVPKLKTVVFATDPQHVIEACNELNWTVGRVFKFTDNTLVRHDAITGEVLNSVEFISDHDYIAYSDVDQLIKRNLK
jgi:predicted glutamine amidotransferase